MRSIVAIVAALLTVSFASSNASADPTADGNDANKDAPVPAKVRVGPFGGLDFSGVTALQAPSSPEPTTPDLFPSSLFGDNSFSLSMGGSNERRNGFPMPDDADWRVQATQVGAMVFGFAALAALCSGGGCMLPSSWLPDQLESEPFFVPDPLPPNVSAGRDLGR